MSPNECFDLEPVYFFFHYLTPNWFRPGCGTLDRLRNLTRDLKGLYVALVLVPLQMEPDTGLVWLVRRRKDVVFAAVRGWQSSTSFYVTGWWLSSTDWRWTLSWYLDGSLFVCLQESFCLSSEVLSFVPGSLSVCLQESFLDGKCCRDDGVHSRAKWLFSLVDFLWIGKNSSTFVSANSASREVSPLLI